MFEWSASPVLVSIGPFDIRWYSLMFVLSFGIGFYLLKNMVVSEKKPESIMDPILLVLMVSTIVGARLGHTLFYDPGYYLSHPVEILKVWEGGLASHGAAIGILLGLWWFARRTPGITFLWLVDRVVIVVALAGFFIRVGNFFNSEIYGHPTDGSFGVVFLRVDSIPRHPVQLYEAITYLIIFIGLFLAYYRTRIGSLPGRLLGWFLVTVFGARLILETFKPEQASFTANLLTMGQWLSVPFILTGLWLLFRTVKETSRQ